VTMGLRSGWVTMEVPGALQVVEGC
jgi:hypothetical protein